MNESLDIYSEKEERLNILTHGLGFLLSIIGLVMLIIKSSINGDVWYVVSFTIFGASLVVLYAASTLYHSAKKEKSRKRLQVFDHAAIYVLIAGTYTPFTLVTLNGTVGWVIFGITWGMALAGVVLKIFYTGRFNMLSTVVYVLMGWIIIFAIKPLINNLSYEGLWWLVFGGVSYTVGAILFSIERIPYNHAIFHVFVLLGSFGHFVSVYNEVL